MLSFNDCRRAWVLISELLVRQLLSSYGGRDSMDVFSIAGNPLKVLDSQFTSGSTRMLQLDRPQVQGNFRDVHIGHR
jgi:hypothetical protein